MRKHKILRAAVIGLINLSFIFITPEILFSQINHSLFFINNFPQNIQSNPALSIDSGFFIGFPIINNINNEIRSSFKYDDYFEHHDDSIYRNPTRLVNVLDDHCLITEKSTINIIYFGLKKKKNSFRFGISLKSMLYGRFDKNLISLLVMGNEQFVGKTTDFYDNSLSYSVYQEYFLSYSRQITPKLSIGISPKFLTGDFNVQIDPADFVLTIDENTYTHTGEAHIHINTSSDKQTLSGLWEELNPNQWLQFSNNLGYAFDFGVNYKANSNLILSVSLLDIGKIKWNKNPKSYQTDTDSGCFEGLYLSDIYDNKIYTHDITKKITDGFTEGFKLEETNDVYTTTLVPKFIFSGSYSFFVKNKVGGLYYAEFFDKHIISSFSINYLRQIGSVLTLGINYNNYNLKVHNVGFVAVLHAGIVQIYFSTNNIIGLVTPQHTNVYQLSFGINFLVN